MPYLPSNTPLMKGPQDNAVAAAQASLVRQIQIQMQFATGRASIFSNIVSPDQVSAQFGVPAGVNAANLQGQTLDARASAWLYGDGTQDPLKASGVAAVVDMPAPKVHSLNRGGGCLAPTRTRQLSQQPPMPTPGQVRQAPTIISTPQGPLYEAASPASLSPSATRSFTPVAPPQLAVGRWMGNAGLTGYAPPWSDAFVQPSVAAEVNNDMGVVAWIKQNPWLSLALAAGGIFAASQGGRRR